MRIDGRVKIYHTRSIDQIMEELKKGHPYEVAFVDGIKYSAEFADKIAAKIDGQAVNEEAIEKITEDFRYISDEEIAEVIFASVYFFRHIMKIYKSAVPSKEMRKASMDAYGLSEGVQKFAQPDLFTNNPAKEDNIKHQGMSMIIEEDLSS